MEKTESGVSGRPAINSIISVSIIAVLFCGAAAANPVFSEKGISGRTYRVMARAYMAYGEYGKAMPLAEKALSIAQQQNAPNEELSLCLLDLAYIYTSVDRYAEAEQLCKLGLSLQKKVYYDKHPFVAYTMRTLAAIYQGEGKIAEGKEVLQQAMDIMLESHPADDAVMAPFHVDFAKLLAAEGKLTEAEEYYDKALELIDRSYGPEHLYTAAVKGSVAELYTQQGRYEEAEALIDKSQAIQEKFYGKDNHLVAGVWLTRAKICRAKGNAGEADVLIEKARNAIQKAGNAQEIARLERQIVSVLQVGPDTKQSVARIFDSSM
jgi:tetratricopeptide (TPR) repeat protein